jgi:hypothetical protein
MTPVSYDQSGVYILYDGNIPVYVGSSSFLRGRLSSHNHRGKFDSIRVIACPEPLLYYMEQYFITELNPPLNKNAARCTDGKYLGMFRWAPSMEQIFAKIDELRMLQ